MAMVEDGVLRSINYRYVFAKTADAVEKLVQALARRRGDKDDTFARRILVVKDDDRGRQVAVQYGGTTYACPDAASYGDAYPVVRGAAWVPGSVCAKCPNRVRSRMNKRMWSCKLLRQARRGHSKKEIAEAVRTANDLLGTPRPTAKPPPEPAPAEDASSTQPSDERQ